MKFLFKSERGQEEQFKCCNRSVLFQTRHRHTMSSSIYTKWQSQ